MFVLEDSIEKIDALEGHFPEILDKIFKRIVFEAKRGPVSPQNLVSTQTPDEFLASGRHLTNPVSFTPGTELSTGCFAC